jgi:signal transduction histidine kinase
VLGPVDLILCDAVLRVQPRRAPRFVASVLVDEDALRREGPWPWSRGRLAELTDRVRASGARGVVFDILLPEARIGDERLAASLGRLPAVLAVGVDDRGGWLLPAPALRHAVTLAHVSFETDRDGVARRFLATKQLSGLSLPALAAAGASLAETAKPILVGAVIHPGFRSGVTPSVSAGALLDGPSPLLKGRIVFVGASAAGIGDRVVLRVSAQGVPEPGVVAQAAACESVLSGDLLKPVPPVFAGVVAGLASLLAAALRGRWQALGTALLPLPFGVLLLAGPGFEFPSVMCTTASLAVAVFGEVRAATSQRRENAASLRRIRELTQIESDLREGQRDEAEARRWLAHDLRTPLTSVRGLAQLLSDFDLSDRERKRVAGLVASETSRLSEMVESLLDLERMKLRDFGATAQRVDLSRLVDERTEMLGRGVGHPVRRSIAPGLEALADRRLLERVIDNLLGNAFKFAPEGTGVDVRLAVSEGRAVLEVSDRGPGISPGDRQRVFQRFTRAGSSESVPGLGLGLAFVAEVASWHGGSAEADSNPGGGSVLRFILPLAPRSNQKAEV